eukprot:scaffold1850_cov194-Pinguiococcus_pyrenoidosus.AAC.34
MRSSRWPAVAAAAVQRRRGLRRRHGLQTPPEPRRGSHRRKTRRSETCPWSVFDPFPAAAQPAPPCQQRRASWTSASHSCSPHRIGLQLRLAWDWPRHWDRSRSASLLAISSPDGCVFIGTLRAEAILHPRRRASLPACAIRHCRRRLHTALHVVRIRILRSQLGFRLGLLLAWSPVNLASNDASVVLDHVIVALVVHASRGCFLLLALGFRFGGSSSLAAIRHLLRLRPRLLLALLDQPWPRRQDGQVRVTIRLRFPVRVPAPRRGLRGGRAGRRDRLGLVPVPQAHLRPCLLLRPPASYSESLVLLANGSYLRPPRAEEGLYNACHGHEHAEEDARYRHPPRGPGEVPRLSERWPGLLEVQVRPRIVIPRRPEAAV